MRSTSGSLVALRAAEHSAVPCVTTTEFWLPSRVTAIDRTSDAKPGLREQQHDRLLHPREILLCEPSNRAADHPVVEGEELEPHDRRRRAGNHERRTHRNRSAITKDVGLLEKMRLAVSYRQANPGHGIQKIVQSVAPTVEMVATLG
jgi:hypothetical protein